MSVDATARQTGSIRVHPYVSAAANAARRAGETLGAIGHALLNAMHETRSAEAARFIQQRRDLTSE